MTKGELDDLARRLAEGAATATDTAALLREVDRLRDVDLREIPPLPEFECLGTAVSDAADFSRRSASVYKGAEAFAAASLHRWASIVQAFIVLVPAGLWTEGTRRPAYRDGTSNQLAGQVSDQRWLRCSKRRYR